MVYTSSWDSPVGTLLLAERGGFLIGAWFEGQKYFLGSVRDKTEECDDSPALIQAKGWLERYFAGERPSVGELPLAPEGSEFRKAVWGALCEIPYGETVTYGEIAQKIAARADFGKSSARAVGGAVGHNPLSVIVPCHRVVGADGSLTGYAGGLKRKIQLLIHEGVNMEGLLCPAECL